MRPPLALHAALTLLVLAGFVPPATPAYGLELCVKLDKSGGPKDGAVVKLREACKTKKDGTPVETSLGNTQDLTCGNGAVDAGEDCDFSWESLTVDLGGSDCASRGFIAGELRCLACSFDESQCNQCGNGVIDAPSEQCDGADLAGEDCTSVPGGFTSGDLSCGGSCTFDTSSCGTCGNGTIDSEEEECDGANLGGNDCTTIPGGFVGGVLQCAANCLFDASACSTPQCEEVLDQAICQGTIPGSSACPICLSDAGVIASCIDAFDGDCSAPSLGQCADAIRAANCTTECECE